MTEQKSKYGIKNFVRIANERLNPDTSTVKGMTQALKTWYCFQYNTTFNDPALLKLTVEELMVLFQMHRIRKDPDVVNNELNQNDYEDWLKRQMGETYVSEEQMTEDMIDYEEKEKEFVESLPEKIITKFGNEE